MPNETISGIPLLATSMVNTDLIEVVQGGNTKRVTRGVLTGYQPSWAGGGVRTSDAIFGDTLRLRDSVDIYGVGPDNTGITACDDLLDALLTRAGITAALTSRGITIDIGYGIYLISRTHYIPIGVRLVGHGRHASGFRLANNSNCDMFRSAGFASLTLTDKWYISDGVAFGIGLEHMFLDGNRANQTSGNGFVHYGKAQRVIDVIFRSCKNVGYYTECGATVGQHDYTDTPESANQYIWATDCGDQGIVNRGPHDAHWSHIYPTFNDKNGTGKSDMSIQKSVGVYDGNCTLSHFHAYGTTNSLDANCQVIGNDWIPEGLVTLTGGNALLRGYEMGVGKVSGTQLTLSGPGNHITGLRGTLPLVGMNGVYVAPGADQTTFSESYLDGANISCGFGFDIDANNVSVGGLVRGFLGSLSYTASTISAASSDNSFNDSAAGFPALVVGQILTTSGFTAPADNQAVLVVVSATASKIVVSGATLVTEAAGSAKTIASAGTGIRVADTAGMFGLTINATLQANSNDFHIVNAPVSSYIHARSISPGIATFKAGSAALNTVSNDLDIITCGFFGGASARLQSTANGRNGVSADRGNMAVTLYPGLDCIDQVFNSPITSAWGISLSTAIVTNGNRFRIRRTANATGASNLAIGGGTPIYNLAVGQACEVVYNGNTSAWEGAGLWNL